MNRVSPESAASSSYLHSSAGCTTDITRPAARIPGPVTPDENHTALSVGSSISSGIARLVAGAFQTPTGPAGLDADWSDRERQVLDLLSQGHPEKRIADRLKISPHTVHTYIRRIYEKLHVHSHAEAVAKYAGQTPG